MVPIDELKVYDGNAKKHTRAQLDAVEASIREFGFRGFVIAWHNEDGVPEIVAGHARTTAARNLGMDEVPVVFCDDLTDAQRRALTLADNQTTMMTGWDEDQLAYELETLSGAFDMGDFGFGESSDREAFDPMADLLGEEFVKNPESSEVHGLQVTFLFSDEDRAAVKGFMDKNGKIALMDAMLKEVYRDN